MKNVCILILVGVLSLAVASCDGEAENAGEALDQQLDNVGDTFDNLGNDIEDACEEATQENC
ncbi:hypothetical protein [Marinagarivorans algicola]|uniref:hypothetical protein n=1 Tax=Marinagarivorans algicola TaxID=1513270 RepID=UPI0006B400C9|nr:hypothetical protein [Marinagarivorans algicola]